MTLVHVDTDLGGDPDDLCALAMLLGWPGVDLAGVTTSTEESGMRAALVSYALRLAGREDVPVAAGAEGSLGGYRSAHDLQDLNRYWPNPVEPASSPSGAALGLLAQSVAAGATIVAIGPGTNLALLEATRPGMLASTRVVVMGGYVRPPKPGLMPMTPEMDYNVQQDAVAARIVWERCTPVLVPLTVGQEVCLREAHLQKLRQGGWLARLVARQGELHGEDQGMQRIGREYHELPDDLLNFHYDPLACAVAVGWDGAMVEELEVVACWNKEGLLRYTEQPGGNKTLVVTGVQRSRFEEDWLRAVVSAGPGN